MGFLLDKCRLVKVDYEILESCYSFSCGDEDLDDFFSNDAMRYKEELLGKTYCFVLDEDPRKIVCMFTLSNDSIRVDVIPNNRGRKLSKDIPRGYVEAKERSCADCHNDPLFMQLPLPSAKRKMKDIVKLPTGKTDNADKKYENCVVQLLASLLYPHLDFAEGQSRTDSGAQIRDLIFYNNQSIPFFKEIYETYGSKQIVFELKNVESLNRDNVNQLNRYLNDNLGKFGVFVTRHTPPKKYSKAFD